MTFPALTLYRKNGSCSFVAHALLHHLCIPFTTISMKPDANRRYEAADGSFTNEDYHKINPSGYVPALVIDGIPEALTELPALLTYIGCLASSETGQKLLGADALERARVVEWMNWLSGTFHSTGVSAFGRPYRFADGEEARTAVASKAWETIQRCYARVEERLKGREFAVSQGLTVVDLYLYLFRRWAEDMEGLGGDQFAKKFPNYDRLGNMVEKIDGVRKALIAEELKPVFGQEN